MLVAIRVVVTALMAIRREVAIIASCSCTKLHAGGDTAAFEYRRPEAGGAAHRVNLSRRRNGRKNSIDCSVEFPAKGRLDVSGMIHFYFRSVTLNTNCTSIKNVFFYKKKERRGLVRVLSIARCSTLPAA